MKMKRILIIGLLLMGFAVSVNAQSTASATATTTIIAPIMITKTVDMNFGNIAIKSTSGTVILSPEGTRTQTGGITLPGNSGTVSAASFNVTGAANYTYSITLPTSDVVLTRSQGSETMILNAFTSNPGTTGTFSASGSQTLNVGATLNVNGDQAAGTYTSTAFDVTVNYN